MGTMYEDYQELDYQRSSSGLYIPAGKWKDIADVLDYGESLGKAARSPMEEKMYQMYRNSLHRLRRRDTHRRATEDQ